MDKEIYRTYLESPEWKKKSEALKRERKACEDCSKTENLQVHHLSYDRIGQELPTDMIVVCPECHSKRHGKTTNDLLRNSEAVLLWKGDRATEKAYLYFLPISINGNPVNTIRKYWIPKSIVTQIDEFPTDDRLTNTLRNALESFNYPQKLHLVYIKKYFFDKIKPQDISVEKQLDGERYSLNALKEMSLICNWGTTASTREKIDQYIKKEKQEAFDIMRNIEKEEINNVATTLPAS